MSWKAEVIADSSGKWAGNALRFAKPTEAENYALDLRDRWTAVRDYQVVRSDDPVNARFTEDDELEHLPAGQTP